MPKLGNDFQDVRVESVYGERRVCGHRLNVYIRGTTRAKSPPTRSTLVDLAADLYLADGAGQTLIGRMFAGNSTHAVSHGSQGEWNVTFCIDLSSAEVAEIERRRSGSDLSARLSIRATHQYFSDIKRRGRGSETERIVDWSYVSDAIDHTLSFADWSRVLDDMGHCRTVHVSVAIPHGDPLGPELFEPVERARQALSRGDTAAALADCRRALEYMRGSDAPATAQPTAGELKRLPKDDRFVALLEVSYSIASLGVHNDEPARRERWSREDTLALLAATAGLAQRFATGDR